jgi:S1-C subfamily serine protease
MLRRIHKALLGMLVLAMLLAPGTGTLGDDSDEYRLGLVQINYNFEWLTTGFFINNDGLIMTVAHGTPKGVFGDFLMSFPMYVKPMDTNTIYEAEIIAVNQKADILLLKIDGYDVKKFFDKFSQPMEDENVKIVGFPAMEWYTQKEGKVVINSVRGFVGVDEAVGGGSSGSPVLNEENEVVGMVSMLDARVNFTIMVSGVALRGFLTAYYELDAQRKAEKFLK